MIKMDKKILKVDLDIKTKKHAINKLKKRFAYMHDIKFFDIDRVLGIYLIKKSSFGALVFLRKELNSEKDVVIMQLMLGSDYRKEANTLLNHYFLEMEYSNRLFLLKRYKQGEIKKAKQYNVTKEIKDYVMSKDRIKNFN